MTQSVLPAEDCVFRVDSKNGFRQAFPMTFNNVELSEDGFGYGGGSTSYIDCGNPESVNITEEITLEALVKTDITNAYAGIIRKYSASSGNRAYALEFNPFVPTDGGLRFIVSADGETATSISTNDFPNTEHLHIMATIRDSLANLYVNGELKDSTAFSSALNLSPLALEIGRSITNISMDGYIKTASIYKRGYTAQEVADRYNEVTFQVE